MPINFPDSPTTGDTHTVGDKTWTYDGTAWNVVVGVSSSHGDIAGLADDDHTQYLLADGTRTATELTVSGDLTVDTSTLHVDSTNNRVGIGTSSPDSVVHIDGGTDAGTASGSGYLQIGSTASTNLVIDDNEIMARNNGSIGTLFVNPDGGITDFNSNVPNNAVSTESIRAFGIRGQLASANGNNELLHLYNNVNIGYPSGWGGQDAPQYGLHVYGAITTSTHPMFVAYSNSTQEPTSVTQILYTGTTANRGNHYNAPNSRFTAPIAGVYQFHVRWWMHTGTSGTAYLYLYKNGSVFTEQRNNEPTTRTEYETISSVFTVTLAVNDYIEVYAYGSGGQFHSSTTVQYSEFSGYLLG